MPKKISNTLKWTLPWLAAALILKVTAEVVAGYRNYLPPDFQSEFLHRRDDYFWGDYKWAFYAHIVSGPVSLILGLLLVSDWFRRRAPMWHRHLGRIQGINVLLIVAPSGLWMARYAAAGPVAGTGFATLAILTGTCVALGWRAAVQRRIPIHERWMWRCFLLLCSAVTLRLVGGFAVSSGVRAEWLDPVAAWASWLVPLAACEFTLRASQRRKRFAAPTPALTHPR